MGKKETTTIALAFIAGYLTHTLIVRNRWRYAAAVLSDDYQLLTIAPSDKNLVWNRSLFKHSIDVDYPLVPNVAKRAYVKV
jgi:hypothetical protein